MLGYYTKAVVTVMNQRNNQRYQENQTAIENAFFDFLAEKDIAHISIREICEKAKVNRSTFYRHCLDIYDLLDKTGQRIIGEFLATIPDDILENVGSASSCQKMMTYQLQHFSDHRMFYVHYLRNLLFRGANDELLQRVWENKLVPFYRNYGLQDKRLMQYYFQFFHSGALRVILSWLESNCLEAPEDIMKVIIAFLPFWK